MKSFTSFLSEAFEVQDRDPKAKQVSIFLGRMQPIHKAHELIIKGMKNPIVVLVKGKASSEDKSRNPFDAEYQKKLLKILDKKIQVREFPTGYIPGIAADMRAEGMEVVAIHAGEDRIGGYKSQFDKLNLPPEKEFHIKYVQTSDEVRKMVSATQVRNAIKTGDEKSFKEYMPTKLHGEFGTMRKKME